MFIDEKKKLSISRMCILIREILFKMQGDLYKLAHHNYFDK